METVTATCSKVCSPDISRSVLLTEGGQAGQLGSQPHRHLHPPHPRTQGLMLMKPHGAPTATPGPCAPGKGEAAAALRPFTLWRLVGETTQKTQYKIQTENFTSSCIRHIIAPVLPPVQGLHQMLGMQR